jgi:hypothetical protein
MPANKTLSRPAPVNKQIKHDPQSLLQCCTMGNRPRVRGGYSVFSALLFAACIYVASAVVSVEYVTSSAGYPTAGDVSVTVFGSGFGTGSAAFSVRIGSTACSQPAIKQTNTRIACKLGKIPLTAVFNF